MLCGAVRSNMRICSDVFWPDFNEIGMMPNQQQPVYQKRARPHAYLSILAWFKWDWNDAKSTTTSILKESTSSCLFKYLSLIVNEIGMMPNQQQPVY